MADVEKATTPEVVVDASDESVYRAGRRTQKVLALISLCMVAFCTAMLGYFSSEMSNVVGGECPDYTPAGGCNVLKENWCKVSQCDLASGAATASAVVYTADSSLNSCPQGCSDACVGEVAEWKSLLGRFDACAARTKRVRQCLPTTDTDGKLANYRGAKAAHSSNGLGSTEAFIKRDSFLDACDAQEIYADRRERGGNAVLGCICVALVAWLIMTWYVLRKPNYTKKPRETRVKPLEKFGDKKGFNHRFHPDSIWLWFATLNALVGFAIQLYSFYTPSTTDIRIPQAQGAWMTIEVITRGVLVLFDKFTVMEASALFFDIGYTIVGFTALLEPFFEAEIVDKLPEADDITDYALAIRVLSFIWPLVSSTKVIKALYIDNFWPSPSTARAVTTKQRNPKRLMVKIALLVLQLGAAFSVYGIMGSETLCHQFRTCARGTCTPNVPAGMKLDTEFNLGSIGYRQEMISDDGSMKWRWSHNSNTKLKFVKVDGTLYADITFEAPNNNVEEQVTQPGTGTGMTMNMPVARTSLSSCATRFEVQCQEVNPRHAFKHLTGANEWVDYNTSMYKFVARHDAGQTSGDPSCFAESHNWWTENAMFTAGPDLAVGGSESAPDLGFIFMEQKNCCWQNPCSNADSLTDYCIVEPPFLAVYAPYGRATIEETYTWGAHQSLPAITADRNGVALTGPPQKWSTALHVFELAVNPADAAPADSICSPSNPSACGGTGGGNTPCDPSQDPNCVVPP
jgi:hypothetical protein